MTKSEKHEEPAVNAEPQKEHLWLQRFVGQWTFEVEATMGQGTPPEKFLGTESVRSLGGLWIQAEGQGEMCGGSATTVMTLGYDPQKQRYVGTWIGSMMTHLWLYEGALDPAGKVLTLDTEGPDMSSSEGKMAKYRDVIEFTSDDQRLLSSHMRGDDGKWHRFMTATYRRNT